MKKSLLQAGLTLIIILVAFMVYRSLSKPIEFENTLKERSEVVVQKLKDIRTLQQAYKKEFGKYTPNFSDLTNFYNNDSLTFEIAMGSEDDSAAVAEGRVSVIKYQKAVKDTLFYGLNFDISTIDDIPFSNNKKFKMGTADLKTESDVDVNVFEAYALYFDIFPEDEYRQFIINLNDKRTTIFQFEGIKVGSLIKPNNDAGNWER